MEKYIGYTSEDETAKLIEKVTDSVRSGALGNEQVREGGSVLAFAIEGAESIDERYIKTIFTSLKGVDF